MSGAVMAAGEGKNENATPAPDLTSLNQQEIADLAHLREEEKLIRDALNI
jgi:hypothetical protein